MTVVQTVSGALRDVVHAGLLTGLRWSGDFTGRMFDPRMISDPYPRYEWVRAQGPLVGNDITMVTAQHAVADRILRDPAFARPPGSAAR